MNDDAYLSGAWSALYAQWPRLALTYAGIVAALVLLGIGVDQAWLGVIPLALALLIVSGYFFVTAVWFMQKVHGAQGVRPHLRLLEMGLIDPAETVVFIDLGIHYWPYSLARHLTTGHVLAVDMYNPQWTPSRALARWRQRSVHLPQDPRLSWREAQLNLIPLPDKSVTAVFVCQVLSELWQEGDQQRLLQEVRRVLQPDGRLLFADLTRTQTTIAALGPTAISFKTSKYWQRQIKQAGFRIREEATITDIYYCARASLPSRAEMHQLAFDLKI